jgi:hypothetical protein
MTDMKSSIKIIVFVGLLLCSMKVWAQDDAVGQTMRTINEALSQGDCERAQRGYNAWKILTNDTNSDIEQRIQRCNSGKANYINGKTYNFDGIEMIYVEGTGSGILDTKSFFIGKYEITQAQWIAIIDNNPSATKNSTHPVHNVNFNDIQLFIENLNKLTGRNFRLPTKSEWLYAAHSGKNKETYKYAGSDNYNEIGWFNDNNGCKIEKYSDDISCTHPVGMKGPNSLGIYDMSGNVSEMLVDGKDGKHIDMGGSWWYDTMWVYAQLEHPGNVLYESDERKSTIGFRLILSF